MGSDQNNNSSCLLPFGDDFLPILMFFFHLNQAESGVPQFDEEIDEEEAEDQNDDGDDDNG